MLCVAVPERPPPEGGFHGADLVLDSLAAVGDWMWPALEAEPAPVTRR